MAIHKKTQITIDVDLDENNIPEQMKWTAPDGGISEKDTKALLLSFWDEENQEGKCVFEPVRKVRIPK